jgi:hypothetical protein
MKKILLSLVVLLGVVAIATAQDFKVLAVNADFSGPDEFGPVNTALQNSGYTFDVITPTAPLPADSLLKYDFVLWYAGNDGVDSLLWSYSRNDTGTLVFDTAVFASGIKQYIDSGKVIWIDGIDVIYDAYGSAPDDFAPGDFVYDYLGISKYLSQSKADDGGLGVSYLLKDDNNSITSVDTIDWTYSTLWYVDGYEITSDAHPLYVMGGASDYPLLGQVTSLYKDNVIFTNIRLGKVKSQEKVDALVKDILDAAKNGTFVRGGSAVVPSVEAIGFKVYPNPATDYVVVNSPDYTGYVVSLYDITGRQLMKKTYRGKVRISVGELTPGIYNLVIKTNKDVANQKLIVR